jgi:hypothetical protein
MTDVFLKLIEGAGPEWALLIAVLMAFGYALWNITNRATAFWAPLLKDAFTAFTAQSESLKALAERQGATESTLATASEDSAADREAILSNQARLAETAEEHHTAIKTIVEDVQHKLTLLVHLVGREDGR